MKKTKLIKPVEKFSKKGRNKLHKALLNGNAKRVFKYLELGLNVTIKDTKLERNYVGWAARDGSLEFRHHER